MKYEQDRGKERERKIRRIHLGDRAKNRPRKRGNKSTKLKGSDDWLPRRELKRMTDAPDGLVYE